MSEYITHVSVVEDSFQLMQASPDICEAFKTSTRNYARFALLGSTSNGGDNNAMRIIIDAKTRWKLDRSMDAVSPRLAFALAWLTHRAADRQMKPVFRTHDTSDLFPTTCSLTHDAFLFLAYYHGKGSGDLFTDAVFDWGMESLPGGEAIDAEELRELMWSVAMQEAHSAMVTKPDPNDPYWWALMLRWQHYEIDMNRYTNAIFKPDSEMFRRFVEEIRFYDEEDPLIRLARGARFHSEQPNPEQLMQAIRAEHRSEYGKLLQLSLGYLHAASQYFTGALSEDSFYEALDIGKPGSDGGVV